MRRAVPGRLHRGWALFQMGFVRSFYGIAYLLSLSSFGATMHARQLWTIPLCHTQPSLIRAPRYRRVPATLNSAYPYIPIHTSLHIGCRFILKRCYTLSTLGYKHATILKTCYLHEQTTSTCACECMCTIATTEGCARLREVPGLGMW